MVNQDFEDLCRMRGGEEKLDCSFVGSFVFSRVVCGYVSGWKN